jgi:hypothetical protein
LGALAVARPAHADGGGQAFRLEYWGDGHCPDAIEFARQVQMRAPQLRPARDDEPALGFYAELAERRGVATGRLTARLPDGREVVREVRGPTCDDVATALALIAALAADPNQPAAPAKAPRPSSPVPAKRRALSAEDQAVLLDEPPRLRASAWTFGLGAGLGFDSSIAPSPGYGLGVSFDAEGRGGSPIRPLFSLSAMRAAAPDTSTRAGIASFTWLAFRAAVCPVRWPEETPLFIRPCAFLDAGLLGGDVDFDRQRQHESKTWFAAGGFARVEALVGEVVSLQLDGGVTVPLKRDSFSAGPGAPSAFEVPSAGILGRIGLSYRFQ